MTASLHHHHQRVEGRTTKGNFFYCRSPEGWRWNLEPPAFIFFHHTQVHLPCCTSVITLSKEILFIWPYYYPFIYLFILPLQITLEFYKSSLQGLCTLPPTVFCLSLTIRVLSRETTLDEASFSNVIPPFCFQTRSCLFPSLHALRALVAKHMNHQRPPPPDTQNTASACFNVSKSLITVN